MSQPGRRQSRRTNPSGDCRRPLRRLLIALVSIVAIAIRVAQPISVSTVATERGCAIVLFAMGIFIGGRLYVHLRIGYWMFDGKPGSRWTRNHRRLLSLMMVIDAALAAALIFNGAFFFLSSNRWLQLAVSLASTLAVLLSAHVVRETIRSDGPPRGADVMEERFVLVGLARDIAKTLERSRLVTLLDEMLWEPRSVAPQLSGLMVFVILSLALATTAQAVAVLPEVGRYIGRDDNADAATQVAIKSFMPTPKLLSSQAPARSRVRVGSPPTYEDLCGGPIGAGRGAPGALSKSLTQAWERVGGASAACATAAHPVPKVSGAYFSPGFCLGEYRSLAVVSSEHRKAELLLEQLARFGRRLVIEGKLSGASPRISMGQGDGQLIFTPAGPYLALRQQKTDGGGGPQRAPWRCTELSPGGFRYTILPPRLAQVWLDLASKGLRTWPTSEAPKAASKERVFAFRDKSGSVITTALCPTPTDCDVKFLAGFPGRDRAFPAVTVQRLRGIASAF